MGRSLEPLGSPPMLSSCAAVMCSLAGLTLPPVRQGPTRPHWLYSSSGSAISHNYLCNNSPPTPNNPPKIVPFLSTTLHLFSLQLGRRIQPNDFPLSPSSQPLIYKSLSSLKGLFFIQSDCKLAFHDYMYFFVIVCIKHLILEQHNWTVPKV